MRLIDADALKEKMKCTNRYFNIKFDIDESPTIDPETLPIVQELREQLAKVTAERDELKKDVQPVVRGEWVDNSKVPDSILGECSQCGYSCGAYTFNFCPNCGADMRGEVR